MATTLVTAPRIQTIISSGNRIEINSTETTIRNNLTTTVGTGTPVSTEVIRNEIQDTTAIINALGNPGPRGEPGADGAPGANSLLELVDVDSVPPRDGNSLVWNAARNKFEFRTLDGSAIPDEEMIFSKRIDFVGDDIIYRGEATVGSLDDSPVWRIRLITMAPDGDVSEKYAGGLANFDRAWTQRATYTFS